MKKIIIAGAILLASMAAPEANAQSFWSKLFGGAASAAANSTDAKSAGENALSSAVNDVVSATNTSLGDATGGILGNLIASVTGSITTTQTNLIGTWSYAKPSVQFESESLLSQAGGTAIAQKVENKLQTYYNMVGIKPGKLVFKFEKDGKLTYSAGSVTREGTYVFNDADKTVTIKTNAGTSFKAYVTVSGNEMALTFEAGKMLELMNTLGSRFQSLATITSLCKQYSGMKVGFAFEKQ